MKKVYKSKQSESILMELYYKQIESLNIAYEDLFAETRFGKAHIVKLGKPDGKPLLLFHGGNSTTPYSLGRFWNLLAHLSSSLCIYAVDTVGHPGKSSQTLLSHKGAEYGQWASDVITSLGFAKMYCMGSSFGAGILVKLMCVAPSKIEKSVLIVPSGIANMSTFNIMLSMGVPMIIYNLTKNEYWLKKAVLPMAIDEKNIDDAFYEMVKISFDHVAVKTSMPSNVSPAELAQYTAPTLLVAAERDCLFPGRKVMAKAKIMIPNLETYLLQNQGHLCVLPDEVKNMIRSFLENDDA